MGSKSAFRSHSSHICVFSLMGDECTDISTVEELSIYCRWVEHGVPVEHFLEILPLKRTNAETIYFATISCLREKNILLSKLVGLGFDGAATRKRCGVQMWLKTNAPHALLFTVTATAIFFNLHAYKLQTTPVELSMCTQHWRPSEKSSVIHQSVRRHWRRYSKFWIF